MLNTNHEKDLDVLARLTPSLTSLTSITLTLPPNSANRTWPAALLKLTEFSPLNAIHLYVMGGHPISDSQFPPINEFIQPFLELHAQKLRKFSVHRLRLQPAVVGAICAACPKLESLFVVVNDYSLVCHVHYLLCLYALIGFIFKPRRTISSLRSLDRTLFAIST